MGDSAGIGTDAPVSGAVDLKAIWRTLWEQRLLLLAASVMGFVIALIIVHIMTPVYTAQLRVMAAQSSSANSSNLDELAGLASLAGVQVAEGGTANLFRLYQESVKSPLVAEQLARRVDIMHKVFEPEFDKASGQFREPPRSLRTLLTRTAKTILGLPIYPWVPPGPDRLREYIRDHVTIDDEPRSPIVTLIFNHPDPVFARNFLLALHQAADKSVRRKTLIRSTESIAYLSSQLSRVTVAEHRAALAAALGDQERSRMMAMSSLPFAAETFGSAITSLQPTKPQPGVLLPAGAVLGLLVGGLIAFLRVPLARRGEDVAADGPNT